MSFHPNIANSMRNGADRAAPENAKQAFSGAFAATGCIDFELIRYKKQIRFVRGNVDIFGQSCENMYTPVLVLNLKESAT